MLITGIITVLILFVWWGFLKMRNKREQEKFISNLQDRWDGWIELVDAELRSLLFGKILYSNKEYVVGVGVINKECLPRELISDIQVKIEPLLLDENLQLCRFIIDFAGGETVLREFQDEQLKEKLMPYIADYSQIQLMLGFDPAGFILVDSEQSKVDFEKTWAATR